MKVRIDAKWDDEARVWVAVADSNIGFVTEADSIDALRDKIAAGLPDLLELHAGEAVEVELHAKSMTKLVAA